VTLEGPFIYRLEYRDRCLQSVKDEQGCATKFAPPMTKVGFKLYIVCRLSVVLYVGVTNRPIRDRLRFGENPNGASGYHGYKWMDQPGPYELFIWNVKGGGDNQRMEIETLEAEIVYAVRAKIGQWPSGQTEIHFHESSNEDRRLSEEILATIYNC